MQLFIEVCNIYQYFKKIISILVFVIYVAYPTEVFVSVGKANKGPSDDNDT